MASVLHLTLDPADVQIGFGALLNELNSEGASGNFSLNAADALWVQQGFPLETQFLNTIQTDYGGGVNPLDFSDAGSAAQTINNWVASETNNKIQNLISPSDLSAATQFVLTNAVYFKGQWAQAFDASQTYNAPFTLASGSQESVSTMHQSGSYQYMDSDGYQVLELPYTGNQLSMVLLLPIKAALPPGQFRQI